MNNILRSFKISLSRFIVSYNQNSTCFVIRESNTTQKTAIEHKKSQKGIFVFYLVCMCLFVYLNTSFFVSFHTYIPFCTFLLFLCTCVLKYLCSWVQKYLCTHALVSLCNCVHVHSYSCFLVYFFTLVLLYFCPCVLVCLRTCVCTHVKRFSISCVWDFPHPLRFLLNHLCTNK